MKKTIVIALYAAIFCLAAALRFTQLAQAPLTESEAAAAMNAFRISQGESVMADTHTGYALMTSILFFMGKASPFWARFLPAVIGSLAVFSPLLFRRFLGVTGALLLSAGLAIDPALLILSRMADGSVIGIALFFFGLGFFLNRKPVLSGIFAALALLGGSAAWVGILIIGLSAAVYYFASRNRRPDDAPDQTLHWQFNRAEWLQCLAGFGITLILAFSLFFKVPSGLGGIFAGLSAFFAGWPQPLSIAAASAGLLFYEGLPILLGIATILITFQRRDSFTITLSAAALAAFILIIVYPGRGFALFPWVGIPLWAFISRSVLARYTLDDVELVPYFGLLALVLVVTVFGLLNLRGVFNSSLLDQAALQIRIASVIGALLIILLASGLVVWGWSAATAAKSLFAAFLLLLLAVNTSTLSWIIRAHSPSQQEIWLADDFQDGDLFSQTVADYRQWNIGSGVEQPRILVAGVQSAALEWVLRFYSSVEYSQTLPPDSDAAMIITAPVAELALEQEYTGQDFVLARRPAWEGLDPWGWLRWLFLRQAPYSDQAILLWVRTDKFPGYEANAQP